MKNKFQSKAVPRGTRTIWRYLGALFLIFTLGIGQMWGATGDAEVASGVRTLFQSYTSRYIKADAPSASTLVDNVYLVNNGSVSNIGTDGIKFSKGAVVFYLKQRAKVSMTFVSAATNVTATIKGHDFIINETTATDETTPEAYRAYTLMAGASKTSADWLNAHGDQKCADGTTTYLTYWGTTIGMTVKSGAIKSESKVYNLFSSLEGDYYSKCFTANTSNDGSVTIAVSGAEGSFEKVLPAGYYAFAISTSNNIGLKSLTFTPVYQLIWALDEGSITSAADAYTNAGYYTKGTALTAPTVEKDGYTFNGWSPAVAATMPAAATTYTATWTAAATYDATFVSDKGSAPANAEGVSSVTLTELTESGWKNIGWKADKATKNGTTDVAANTLIENGETITLLENTTFTAQWAQLYTVTYNKAGGEEGNVPTQEALISGEKFEVAGQGTLTPATEGQIFRGWSDGIAAEPYKEGDEYTIAGANVNFAAVWETPVNYTITLDAKGGSVVGYEGWDKAGDIYSKTVVEGTEVSLLAFTKADVQLMFFRDGSANEYSGSVTLNGDMNLSAIWGKEKEVEIYYWEGAEGAATQRGGTATHYNGSEVVDGNTRVNYKTTANDMDYYTLSLNKNDDYSADHIRIALDQALKEGDEIEITGFCNKDGSKVVGPKVANSSNVVICSSDNVPDIDGGANGGVPTIQTKTLNSSAEGETTIKLTRSNGATTVFITKLVITRTEVVEEMDPAATPTITTQPTGGTYAWDATTTQTVVATVSDGGTLSYQWYKKGETDTKVGSNSVSYAPTVSGTYYVIVTNTKTGYAKTTTKSNEVLVTINPRPSYKVSYYDGKVKLGEETVYEGESPINAGNFDNLPMATFQGWFNNEDLAPEHAVATIGGEVITEATSYYSKWNKTFAQDVDLVQLVLDNAEEDAYKTYDYAEFLSDKGYLLTEGTGNENALDKSNAFDTGLKLKKSTDNKLQFNVEAGKIVKLTVGKINGMSIAINGASATAIPGGTDATHLGVSYYYSANPQAVTIAETSANYNMLRAIAFLDPMKVTYDVATNGGTCATEDATFTGTALTLPEATKSGWQFDGWFTTANDETETGELVGEAGETYIPSAGITLYARFTETTTLATLTDIKVNGTTVKGFAVDKYEYTIELPYKTAVVPTITYTRGYEGDGESTGEVVTISPNPISAVFGDVTLHVVSEDETNNNDYVLHFTEAPKDMLCLVWADVDGDNKLTYNATKSKYYAAADVTLANSNVKGKDSSAPSGKKFQSDGYLKIALNEGTFNEGDIVALDVTYGTANVMHVFKAQTALEADVIGTASGNTDAGLNKVAITEDAATLWLVRDGDYDSWNPHVDYVAVYRAYPNPLVGSMAINSIDVTVNNAASTKTITGVMPSGTNFASLSISNIAYLSNNPSETEGVLSGSWNESTSQYEGTFTVTDKDLDVTVYTVTLTEDVAVESVSVSGETTVAAKSQITLTATVLPADVANKDVIWSSSDETKATVDANGVVTGKAAGSVTITATSVADNTKKGTLDIEVTKFVGTERAYWFVYAVDAEANGVENNSTVFGSAPTGSNNGGFELTLEEGWTVTTTKKTGSTSSFGTFTVPADFTATWYAAVKAGGNNRVLNMKQGDVVKYSVALTNATDPEIVKIENIAAGTYDVVLTGGSSISGAYLFAAELNSYPLTSVALEEGFNLRLGQSRTPVFTITPAKAAVVSQVWNEVSRTGASDAELNEETGEITAGTEEGTLTVMVTLTDAFGNVEESGNCVVKIVNIIDQKDVTGSMTWNWTGAGTADVTINNEEALVLGNYINGDEWAYIKGTKTDYAYNTNNSGCYQGYGTLSFKTTVPGLVTITARRISNNADLKIGEDVVLSVTDSKKTSKAYFVPAGEVNIIADATKGVRILKIEFDANITADKAEGSHFGGYTRPVTIDRMGTVCVDHNVPAGCIVGAEVYKLLYWKYGTSWENCQMVDFEQVDEMNAGEPYMIIPTESTFALFYGKTTVDEPAAMDNGFTGTFVAIEAAYENVLYGKYGIVNNMIQRLGHNCNSPANRAYIDLSQTPSKEEYEASVNQSSAPVKKKRISLSHKAEQVMTSLDAINVESEQIQKVIIDGQMYVVRGGHVYDATGKLVK